jgi:hypothetical protein
MRYFIGCIDIQSILIKDTSIGIPFMHTHTHTHTHIHTHTDYPPSQWSASKCIGTVSRRCRMYMYMKPCLHVHINIHTYTYIYTHKCFLSTLIVFSIEMHRHCITAMQNVHVYETMYIHTYMHTYMDYPPS